MFHDIDTKNDTLYCGVRKSKVHTANPTLRDNVIHQWFFHQRERTTIYYQKEILKRSPPWTKDPILATYKFVNTKRRWDKQTKWLLNHVIFNGKLSYSDKLLNCILFRVINKGETLHLLGGAIHFSKLTITVINTTYRSILEDYARVFPSYAFFSNAYILGGPKACFGKLVEKLEGKPEPNMVLRMIKFIFYHADTLLHGIENSHDQQELCNHLVTYHGIGSFLAYQIFIDMTYIEEFQFTEHNFVISGPGCERGLKWIFEYRDGMTSEECLFWFTLRQHDIAKRYKESWNMDKVFSFLPAEERRYTLMDMENSGACEIDKRCRTLFSNKRPKQKYTY